MNRAAKLGRKSPNDTLAKQQKKPSPRNPSKDLNSSSSLTPSTASAESQRGCFRFLSSNPSSSKDSSISRPKSRSVPKTPKSAPLNRIPSTNPAKSSARKDPLTPNLETANQLGLKKSKIPDLIQRWNRRKPSSVEQVIKRKDASLGNNAEPDLEPISTDQVIKAKDASLCKSAESEFRFEVGNEGNGAPWSDLRLASIPEKTLEGFNHEMGFGLEMKEVVEDKVSKTPSSTNTPPIQASISPEIVNGSSLDPTPVCFAAGHVIAGVQDRRKCRPRGILSIDGASSEAFSNLGPLFTDGGSNGLHLSETPPPLSQASMHWLSSPSKDAGCFNGASRDLYLPPCVDSDEGRKASPFETKISSYHDFCGFSPSSSSDKSSSKLGWPMGAGSPLHILKTPTSGSSISPFSAILQKAAVSSGLTDFRAHRKGRGYRYDSAIENSPVSGDCWGDENGISTPSSHSSSNKLVKDSFVEPRSITEALGTMRLSCELSLANEESDILPLSGESFQFGCTDTPLDSVDLSCFRKPLDSNAFTAKEPSMRGSEKRISWREGLASRIFEMGELDCYKWLSDDEENTDYFGEVKAKSKLDSKSDPINWISMLEEKDDMIGNGFGSIDFTFDKVLGKEREEKLPPIPCAESISTEASDGLISSGDSDWTLFYKNHLFET